MNTFEHLLTTEFFLVVVGIFAVIYTLRRSFPKFFEKKGVINLLPILPLVVGMLLMAFIPALSKWDNVGARVLHGLVAGFMAGHFHKIGKQTILAPILDKMDERKTAEGKKNVE